MAVLGEPDREDLGTEKNMFFLFCERGLSFFFCLKVEEIE